MAERAETIVSGLRYIENKIGPYAYLWLFTKPCFDF